MHVALLQALRDRWRPAAPPAEPAPGIAPCIKTPDRLTDLDPTALPPLLPAQLFDLLDQRTRLTHIKRLTGFPDEHWNSLAQSMLDALARTMQLLPASQSHHHAGPGGLIVHSLEVCEQALRHRRSLLLPRGASPDEVAEQQHVWTYAIFVSALLHDAGKALANCRVDVLRTDSGRRTEWTVLGQDLPTIATSYQVHIRQAPYRLHERLAPALFGILIPPMGRDWLAQHPELLGQVMAACYGDHQHAGDVGEAVMHGDRRSTAKNLGQGDRTQLLEDAEPALVDQIMRALRQLLAAGTLKQNRDGAAAWFYQGDVWVVCKTGMDAVREYLKNNGVRGIPARNDRLFDIIQEHSECIPTPDGRAIWRATVEGDGYTHTFTMLRFHITSLFGQEEPPEDMVGRVVPTASTRSAPPRSSDLVTASDSVPDNDPTDTATGSTDRAPEPEDANLADTGAAESASASAATDADTDTGTDTIVEATDLDMPAIASNKSGRKRRRTPSAPTPPVTDSARTPPPETTPHAPGSEGTAPASHTLAEAFLTWIGHGIKHGTLSVNRADAIVHGIPEGLLLVSPMAFKQYAKAHSMGNNDWMALQRAINREGYTEELPNGKNVITYEVDGSGTLLRGIVVPQPARWVASPPRPNPLLRRSKASLL